MFAFQCSFFECSIFDKVEPSLTRYLAPVITGNRKSNSKSINDICNPWGPLQSESVETFQTMRIALSRMQTLRSKTDGAEIFCSVPYSQKVQCVQIFAQIRAETLKCTKINSKIKRSKQVREIKSVSQRHSERKVIRTKIYVTNGAVIHV